MNTVETIQQKIILLPPQAQEEVLEAVEQIEERYLHSNSGEEKNRDSESANPLALLAQIRIEAPPDFSARHDFYAHGKLEE